MVRCRLREKALAQPMTKLLFGFLAIAFFVSAVYNNYRGMAYVLLTYAAVTCALYLRSVMTRPLFHFAMDLACVGSVWCAVAAFVQKQMMAAAMPNYRPVSFFTNANYYGMMIEFVILIAVYRIFTNARMIPFYCAVITVNLAGLYLTASCSAFAAMCISVAVLLAYKRGKKAVLIFLAAIGVFLAAGILYPQILPRSSVALQSTISQRLSIWEASWRAFRRTPVFGRGASAYPMICEQYGGYKTFHSHNLTVDILLNFGLAGMAALCCYAAAQIRLLVVRLRCSLCRNMDILAVAALTAVAVHGLTDVTIMWVQTAGLFFLMTSSIGIGSGFSRRAAVLPSLASRKSELQSQTMLAK